MVSNRASKGKVLSSPWVHQVAKRRPSTINFQSSTKKPKLKETDENEDEKVNGSAMLRPNPTGFGPRDGARGA
ncbi:hypothetical protein G7046_g1054 [Stylonectria norvegica]|nr:hypothetical protein G7046_g1054 [Stylonectria norvegica]